jgi:hypothetical protein
MRPHLLTSAALGIVLVGAALGAQQVRGTIRDSTSRLPIAGAVVTTLDSIGRVGRRTLSDERGAFVAIAPSDARRLRIVRLGFRPVEIELSQTRGLETTLNVVMLRIPYQLQPVRITAGASCPRRSDRAAALALLEQARAGLLATVVARSERPAEMKRLLIERRMMGTSGKFARHSVQIESVRSTVAAFRAGRSAPRFVKEGFADDAIDAPTFFAPDAEVLLDEGFAAGYCFSIMDRNRARPNQVGLGFKAADSRRGRIDVDGALWIDTVARALVDIEFRYVGLEHALDRFEPGGHVEFREMANGVVLIDRWFIRLAGAEPDTANGGRRPLDPVSRRQEVGDWRTMPYVVAEVGGELARATWPDGYNWVASLGTLSLTVTADKGLPSPRTKIRLDDTNYEATTDSAGHLEITDLAPGPYSAVVVDERLEPIGTTINTTLSFVATRDSTARLRLKATTAESYVANRCRSERRPFGLLDQQPNDSTAWVIGRVMTRSGEPIAGARVTTMGTILQSSEARRIGWYDTGTDGLFVHCGFKRYLPVTITVKMKGVEIGRTSQVLDKPLNVIAVHVTAQP